MSFSRLLSKSVYLIPLILFDLSSHAETIKLDPDLVDNTIPPLKSFRPYVFFVFFVLYCLSFLSSLSCFQLSCLSSLCYIVFTIKRDKLKVIPSTHTSLVAHC
jgi:hypothetical protein